MKNRLRGFSRILFISCLLLIISACSENLELTSEKSPDEEVKSDQKENLEYVVETDEGQEFTIYRAYLLLEEYIDKVTNGEYAEEELDVLYEDIILTPFTNRCVPSGSQSRIESIFETPAGWQITELEKVISKLKEKDLVRITEEALLDATEILPSEEKTVTCLMATWDIHTIEGLSTGPHTAIYFYHKNSPIAEEPIKGIIAHEYMHGIDPNYYPEHIIDLIVGEGKAVYFQKLLYPRDTYHTIYEHNPELTAYIWEHRHMLDAEIHGIINGTDGTFPRDASYSEGYKIIQSLVEEEPNITMLEILELDSDSIVERSKYFEKLGFHL